MITALSYAERGLLVWDQHRRILDALARGDADGGVALVSDHISNAGRGRRPIPLEGEAA